jgi:hypothetical protein
MFVVIVDAEGSAAFCLTEATSNFIAPPASTCHCGTVDSGAEESWAPAGASSRLRKIQIPSNAQEKFELHFRSCRGAFCIVGSTLSRSEPAICGIVRLFPLRHNHPESGGVNEFLATPTHAILRRLFCRRPKVIIGFHRLDVRFGRLFAGTAGCACCVYQ